MRGASRQRFVGAIGVVVVGGVDVAGGVADTVAVSASAVAVSATVVGVVGWCVTSGAAGSSSAGAAGSSSAGAAGSPSSGVWICTVAGGRPQVVTLTSTAVTATTPITVRI